jgi:hypothetical protein
MENIKLIQLPFTYTHNNKIHKVFKVISDIDFFAQSFILDNPCEENNFIVPSAEIIEEKLISDWRGNKKLDIIDYIYNERFLLAGN